MNTTCKELPLLLTDKEVAEELRIGRSGVWALIKQGTLETVRVGVRSTRITRASLLKVASGNSNRAA